VITGRYLEVDPPHRMLIEWDCPATDQAAPTAALIEFTFTPTGDETTVEVQLSGLSAEDAAFYLQLFARYLDRIAAAEPRRLLRRWTGLDGGGATQRRPL
jgi:uncharacterized protein YndB with AHSA1/START domain